MKLRVTFGGIVPLSLSLFALLLPVSAFAEELILPPGIDNQAFWEAVLAALGNVGGLSAIGIAALVVQLGMKFLLTPMANISAAAKYLLYAGLHLVSTVLVVMANGGTIGAALLSGAGIAALATFAYEGLKVLGVGETVLNVIRLIWGVLKPSQVRK